MPAELPRDAPGWRDRARVFAERSVRPVAEEIDRSDRLPDPVAEEARSLGFLGLGIPRSWDGSGGDTRSIVAVLEEIARESAAVAVEIAVHLSVCAAPILEWGSGAQREKYLRPLARGDRLGAFALTEPGAGSDTAGLTTRYERDAEGFRLRGTKMFTSNAVSAGTILVFATHDPALGHKGISGFVVPPGTPGVAVAQRLDKLGLRGSETTELVLDGAQLPADALLGPEGAGLKVALGALTGGRVGIASCALGVATAAFETMREAARREPADWKRALLARAYAHLASARALVALAAERRDAGAPFVMEASAAKLVASQAAVSIASAGLEIAGPEGARSGHPAERLFRDARVFPIVEGTTEIQELILGRQLLAADSPQNA